MSQVNCLTDHAKRVLAFISQCRTEVERLPWPHVEQPPIAKAIIHLSNAIEALVLHDLPLWEKRDESGYPADQEEP